MDSIKVLEPIVFEDCGVRSTSNGLLSVFDLIGKVGKRTNPRKDWERLSRRYPEFLEQASYFQFPGAGQRLTPVVPKETAVQILGVVDSDLTKLPTEKDLEDWFVDQHPGCSRQVRLPSGKRMDVVLQNGTVCELKIGQATEKALDQLIDYLMQTGSASGWIVAQSFTPGLIAATQGIRDTFEFDIQLVTPDGFSPKSSCAFTGTKEYREEAAKLYLAFYEDPVELAIAAIERIDSKEKLEEVISILAARIAYQ